MTAPSNALRFSPRLLALVPVAVAINLAVGRLVAELSLPVYLDTIGTVLASALAGPWAGILAGLVSQLLSALVSGYQWLAFAPIQVVIALLAAAAASQAGYSGGWRSAGWGALTGLVAGASSSVIAYWAFKGVTAGGVTALGALFRSLGLPLAQAVAVSSIGTDVLDKTITFALAGVALRRLPRRMTARYPWAERAVGRTARLLPAGAATAPVRRVTPVPHRGPPRPAGDARPLPMPPRAPAALHPFTPFVLVLATAALAFVVPAPQGPGLLYAAVVAVAIGVGQGGAVRGAVLVCAPLWLFLVVIHGVLGDGPGPELFGVALSRDGLRVAVAQAGRFGAIITATLAVYRTFDPSRFLDAMAARGWSFHAGYLLVATLQAAPRLRRRAGQIIESQRCRGLRLAGGPVRRAAAVAPLLLPLVLGALTEVDEHAMALETRAVAGGDRRTALDAPPWRGVDRAAMLGALALVAAGAAWRAIA